MSDILKNSSSRVRLSKARKMAEEANKNHSHSLFDWRYFRTSLKTQCGLSQGFNTNGSGKREPVWVCFNESDIPAISVDFADEVDSSIKHTGWFADEYQDQGTIRGVVCRLEGRRWLAGWYWSDNGEYCIYQTIFDDAIDAASAADSLAEDYADIC